VLSRKQGNVESDGVIDIFCVFIKLQNKNANKSVIKKHKYDSDE